MREEVSEEEEELDEDELKTLSTTGSGESDG
jgi:hypothetical protein